MAAEALMNTDMFDPPQVSAADALAATAVPPDALTPSAAAGLPSAVQVVEATPPFYKDPTFWLWAAGGTVALWLLLRQKSAPISFGNVEPEATDTPDEFFNDAPPRKRKRRKAPPRKRRAALAEVVEDEADAEAADAAEEVHGEAEVVPERGPDGKFLAGAGAAAKPKKKRKRKSKALAESAPAPEAGEPVGASEAEAEAEAMDEDVDTSDVG
jgi:hypothetical protein